MDLEAFKAFIQDRFLELDPTTDISEGSQIDADVVQPILDYVGASQFDQKAYEFVLARMRQFNPEDLVDEGDAITDLAAKPLAHIIDPLVQEQNRLRNEQSLRFPDVLSRESAASLGANFFVDMEDGTFTTGTVRVFFSSPLALTATSSNVVTSVNL